MFNILSWALVSYNTLPSPFHYFFSWLSPLRWFFGSLMGSHIFPLAVKCAENELTRFNVPAGTLVSQAGRRHIPNPVGLAGQTCAEYAAPFLATAVGYLATPDATSNCGYCEFSNGGDYVGSFGYKYEKKWENWGIFICEPFVLASRGRSLTPLIV